MPGAWGALFWIAGDVLDVGTRLSATNPPPRSRFAANPWVRNSPHVRFYASAPLISTDRGHRYGTL